MLEKGYEPSRAREGNWDFRRDYTHRKVKKYAVRQAKLCTNHFLEEGGGPNSRILEY